MKIAIIISIILGIFGSAGYYVYTRATQAFTGTFVSSKVFLGLYILVLVSFFMGKIIEHYSLGFISNFFVRIGSYGLGFFIYALLIIIFFDFIRFINFIIPFYPSFFTADYQKTKLIVGLVSILIISIINIKGYLNARTPVVKELEVSISKSKANFDSLNIVAISDIHLGTMVNKSKTQRLINVINELNPDLVLIAGDIIDDNIKVVKHYELLENFKNIHSKYGVYACMGNHEYISNAHTNLEYFEENGIHILKDTTVKIADSFYIIGRDDLQGERISGKVRKSIDELTTDVDFELPVFLLDHQPFKLDKIAKFPIDLQFSGHTHNGQIWPFNYITGLLFEQDWGYLKKNSTHFYISAGFGTAVMPLRVGNKSEIVSIKIINDFLSN
ncbi:MAG: metallophosphoesterase [Bacteroidales bacterium]|nr:metallophosphoesterase [Bacteroidales bacterium]